MSLMPLMSSQKLEVSMKSQNWAIFVKFVGLIVDLVVLVVCVVCVVVLLVIVIIIIVLDVLDALDVLAKTRGLYQVPELSYEACSLRFSKFSIMYHSALGPALRTVWQPEYSKLSQMFKFYLEAYHTPNPLENFMYLPLTVKEIWPFFWKGVMERWTAWHINIPDLWIKSEKSNIVVAGVFFHGNS